MLKDAAQAQPCPRDLLDSLWDFLSSVRTAITLLSISAAAILIGTVVEQNQPPEKYVSTYGAAMAHFMQVLGIFDLYHTAWFEFLMALICVNLILSNFNRAEKVYRKYHAPPVRLEGAYFRTAPVKEEITALGARETAVLKLDNAFLRLKYRFLKETGPDAVFYYADRGRTAIWGSFIAHIGLLMLFAGVIYGHFPGHGFERSAILSEGQAYYIPESRFSITLKKFQPKWDEERRPLLYRSTLEVTDDSGRSFTSRVEVNRPLTYRGVKVYQATYGPAAILGHYVDAKGKSHPFRTSFDERRMMFFPVHLPGGKEWVGVLRRFVPDFAVGPGGEVGSFSKEPVNPACYLTVVTRTDRMPPDPKSIKPAGWMTEIRPVSLDGVKFYLDRVALYSGFQLRRDPGVPIIFASFLVILVGVCLTFYVHHKVIRVRVGETEEGVEAVAAASRCDKEQDYAREFETLKEALRSY